MQNESANVPVEEQAAVTLNDSVVKNKIKSMVVDLLNTGMRNEVYTVHNVKVKDTFEQLHMTENEKTRLILQCDEYFKIDMDPSVLGIVRIIDLVEKVEAALIAQERLEIPAEAQSCENTEG